MKTRFPVIVALLILICFASSCSSSQSILDARATSIVADVFAILTVEAPRETLPATEKPFFTSTDTPTSIPTAALTPTPLPGRLVYPIQSLSDSIPWLPWDEGNQPGVMYLGFGLTKPPFDILLVRKAFTAAIDREAIAALAERLDWVDVRPATSFIHPEVLGRDLYNDVGIPFNPEQARDFLTQAGYSDPSSFPPITMVISIAGQPTTGIYFQMAELIVDMWKEYLGVNIEIEDKGTLGDYYHYLYTHDPELFRVSFITTEQDGNDPDSVLRYAFYTKLNVSNFSNNEFDSLIEQASSNTDPIQRQILYIKAERLLCEEFIVVIPLVHYSR
jgi:ABC-type transport system substrate-binding protein